MSSIEEVGTHSGHRVRPVVFLSSSLIPAFMPGRRSVCHSRWCTTQPEWDTRAVLMCPYWRRVQKLLPLSAPNSLISWARCWRCCPRARPAAATAVICAYLNGELITSSQSCLSTPSTIVLILTRTKVF